MWTYWVGFYMPPAIRYEPPPGAQRGQLPGAGCGVRFQVIF